MVADAIPLNKIELLLIELLLKMIPRRPPFEHKNRDDTQATHLTRHVHSTHRYYTCFFNNGGHPKGHIRDDVRLGSKKHLVTLYRTKNKEVSSNSSKKAIKEGIQQDMD